jgi:hypothetical protein
MIRRMSPLGFVVLAFAAAAAAQQSAAPSAKAYRSPEAVAAALKAVAAKAPQLVKVVTVGRSVGGRDLVVLRIGAAGRGADPETRPAIFVAANPEGAYLPATEAALALVDRLVGSYASDKTVASLLDRRTVWVAPLLNPDAAAAAFAPLKIERRTNGRAVDDDADGRTDEDGFEDLDGDGAITLMRVKDPEGKWIPDPKEPRLLRLADPKKGEKGVYTVYTEGIDNDGDGAYNEDPPGGVEINRNFPHDFEYGVKAAGGWPASEPETSAVLKFMTDHPSIALVLAYGSENTLLNMQQTGQARVGGDRVKVPKMYAGFLGLDPDTEYTLKEIVDLLKGMRIGGGMEIDESLVAMFLGLGPAVAIDREDQPLFDAVQKDYKDGLKAAKIEDLDKRAKGVGKGAFAAYAYYQFGVPVFSMDLWAVPEPKKEAPAADALTPDKLKGMTSEEFSALGEEKIAAFLKAQGAPPNFSAGMLLNMVKSGQVTPAKMAEMMEKMPKLPGGGAGEEHPDAYLLKWSDTALQGRGFAAWKPVKHPQLGEVEVGGFRPGLKTAPPLAGLDATIAFHTDFCLGLMAKLADVEFKSMKVEPLGGDAYRISAWVSNVGWFPTATGQGRRSQAAWPLRVKLKLGADQILFSGRPVETIPSLNGGDTRKLEWTVRGRKGSKIGLSIWAPRTGSVETSVTL